MAVACKTSSSALSNKTSSFTVMPASTPPKNSPGATGAPDGSGVSPEELAGAFRRELKAKEHIERRFGTSLVGPHRDEVTFRLNGLDMRSFSSQGQHKTFVISLKLAEFLYLKSRCGETPLLLLDDVFAELDDERTAKVIGYIENIGQAFLTSTHRRLIESWNLGREECRTFLIEGGAVAEQRAVHHA